MRVSVRNAAAILLAAVIILSAGVWSVSRPKETVASDFFLYDLDGKPFRLSDLRGKVVLIDFMATWCVPCIQQISNLKGVWERYEDKIVLISIDVDPRESEDLLRSFVQQFPYATWIWAKDTVNLVKEYEVTQIPKTVIIDQEGYIRYSHIGVVAASVLNQEIERLIR